MRSLKTTIKHLWSRKYIVIFFTLVMLSGLSFYYINLGANTARNFEVRSRANADVKSEEKPKVESKKKFIMHLDRVENNITCHFSTKRDSLPSAEDLKFHPRPNSIFFHETSCQGGLSSRQACAVESAARTNPKREVYVLFSAPVSHLMLMNSCLAKLRIFPNIRVARVHLSEYSLNTPLEEMVAKKPFYESKWWVEHTSDVLRSLTLYKWGGIYLDTDMIVARPLTSLGLNWVAKEDGTFVNAAAIAVSTDHLGRKLAEALINEVNTTYRPDLWIHNGPGAITRVLHKFCNTHNVADWSSSTCQGLQVYNSEYFYPIHYSQKNYYFQPGDLGEREARAYTHHLWNKLTYKMKVENDSRFARMAKRFCPIIYDMYGDDFGI